MIVSQSLLAEAKAPLHILDQKHEERQLHACDGEQSNIHSLLLQDQDIRTHHNRGKTHEKGHEKTLRLPSPTAPA